MSRICAINVIQAKCYNRLVRDVTMSREDELFFSDLGAEPMSKEQAYDAGSSGGGRQWVGSWRRGGWADVVPAMPADCIRPFDMGKHVYDEVLGVDDSVDWAHEEWLEKQAELAWEAEERAWGNDAMFDYPAPMYYTIDAFYELERQAEERKQRELEMLAQGVPSDDEIPVWFTRAENIKEGTW